MARAVVLSSIQFFIVDFSYQHSNDTREIFLMSLIFAIGKCVRVCVFLCVCIVKAIKNQRKICQNILSNEFNLSYFYSGFESFLLKFRNR